MQGKEIANLELKSLTLETENANLNKDIANMNRQLDEYESMYQNMLIYIKLQADEIRELDDSLKKSKLTNNFLDVRVRNFNSNALTGMENNEKQVKELYDTITEVFIERIEELKNENEQLKNEIKNICVIN